MGSVVNDMKKTLNGPEDDLGSYVQDGLCIQIHMGGTTAGWIAQSLTKAGRDEEKRIMGRDPDDDTDISKKTCAALGYSSPAKLPDMPRLHEYKWSGLGGAATMQRSAWRKPSLLIVML